MIGTNFARKPQLLVFLLCFFFVLMTYIAWSAIDRERTDVRHISDNTIGNTTDSKNEDLLVYVYFETPEAKINLQFFLNHAVHDKMDFVFVVNGKELSVDIPKRPNFEVIRRENRCYDLGALGEILWAGSRTLRSRYKRFLFLNASVRGPFMPAWAQQSDICWSDMFFNHLSQNTKLVGLTSNCARAFTPHIQSMVLAVDRTGLDLIRPALRCATDFWDAVNNGETRLTSLVRNAGFDAVPITSEARGKVYKSREDYWRQCKHGDQFYPNGYSGMDIHPYDSIFAKVHRTVVSTTSPPSSYSAAGLVVLERLTAWADAGNYSSYDFCKR